MILPDAYDPLLAVGREAMQRAAAERGLTRPGQLPADRLLACAGEAIAAFNRRRLFGDAGPAVPPFPDTAEGRRLVVAYLVGYGPVDEYLRHENLEDLFIQGHAAVIARYGHAADPDGTSPPPGKRLVPGCFRDDAHLVATFRARLEEVGAVWDAAHLIRYEGGFDIEAAVNAAVAALPFRQVRIGASPPGQPDGSRPEPRGLVGVPSYFWYDDDEAAPFGGFLVAAPGGRGRTIRAWVVLHPAETTWAFGDGAPPLTTAGRGVPWPEAEPAGPGGAPHPQAIAHAFEGDGAFVVTARTRWLGRWGLYEEFGTACWPGAPCPRSIPIYSTTPVLVDHARPYEVMEVRSVRVE